MAVDEQVMMFNCEGDSLVGILSPAAAPAARGVLIAVGGPQYRAGSHRQFTLLARELAASGVPCMRFDYRGMGDSTGTLRTFEEVEADLRRAIDRFFEAVPALKEVVIWGLCDAASAALFYAPQDARVGGLVLLNPWVHTEQGTARVYLRHYYVKRLFQAEFWRKIARGEFSLRRSAASLGELVRDAAADGAKSRDSDIAAGARPPPAGDRPFLPDRMEDALRRFRGRVLLILSGNDFIAQEFKDLAAGSRRWRNLLNEARVTRRDIPESNHTFARREWRDQIARWTEAWVKAL